LHSHGRLFCRITVACVSPHTDGIRYADVAEGERVLYEIIHECPRSLEAIGHAKVDLEAREWARRQGLKG
jgi:hypothetical protein